MNNRKKSGSGEPDWMWVVIMMVMVILATRVPETWAAATCIGVVGTGIAAWLFSRK